MTNKIVIKIIQDESLDDSEISYINQNSQKFWKYLFNNRIAHTIAIYLDQYKEKLSEENKEKINQIENSYKNSQQKYYKTLAELKKISQKYEFEFLLYKSTQNLAEPINNDIDIVVTEDIFDKVMKYFELEGFDVVEDEPRKGKCDKKGLLTIEPHTSISWRGVEYISSEYINSSKEKIFINNQEFFKTNTEIDIITAIAQLVFEKSYLPLGRILNLKISFKNTHSLDNMLSETSKYKWQKVFGKVYNILRNLEINTSNFPYFVSYSIIYRAYYEILRHRINSQKLSNRELLLATRDLSAYIYWRARYNLIEKLPFEDDWSETNRSNKEKTSKHRTDIRSHNPTA